MSDRANSRASGHHKQKQKHALKNKYESSEEDELSRHSKKADSRTNSLKRRGHANLSASGGRNGGHRRSKPAKSPVPDIIASDPDDDAINEYYAVRHR